MQEVEIARLEREAEEEVKKSIDVHKYGCARPRKNDRKPKKNENILQSKPLKSSKSSNNKESRFYDSEFLILPLRGISAIIMNLSNSIQIVL